jgi:hypothetical protein
MNKEITVEKFHCWIGYIAPNIAHHLVQNGLSLR